MAYEVRSAALNLYRKNSFEEQKQDLLKALRNADVVSLSEVHGDQLLMWAQDQGFGIVKSKGDTAIVYNAAKFEVSVKGSETLNETEGPTGGMRSREAAYALFRDKTTGHQFYQIAAHTTPPRQGRPGLRRKIRREQYDSIAALKERLERKGQEDGQRDIPVIVAGDLNFKQPRIRDMDNATQGGVMHTLASGFNALGTKRRSGNSDHAIVTTKFSTGGKGNNTAILGGDGDPLSEEELEREYGSGYAFFNSDPELKRLLKESIENNYSQQQFTAQLQNTKWYQTHSDHWRKGMALRFTDPASFQERTQNARDQIENLAGQYGVQLTRKEISRLAERAFLLGWSEEQVLDHIARDVRPGKGGLYEGELAGVESQLRNTAFRNGVRIKDKDLQSWMKAIVKGEADVSQYQNFIRGLAAQTFGAYGKEIKSGVDLMDVAAPYMNSMAEILELNPESIDLFDKTVRKALSHRNEKGEFIPMSMTDFEDSLRADRRWQYTDQARDIMKGYAIQLGKMWGVTS